MPEIATQVEIKDTKRNVYTQCGGQGGITTSVIAEYKTMKEIYARPRVLTNPKKKQPRKPGMKISEVNTEKIKMHRKCVGTDDIVREITEEPEIMILKEINHVNRIQIQPTPKEERKRTWRQSNLSRQEKLYADILASEAKRKRGKEGKENKDRRFSERQTRSRERRRLEKRREEEAWLEKFREWSPTQEWPITKEWKRGSGPQGQQKIASNRESYLRLKF